VALRRALCRPVMLTNVGRMRKSKSVKHWRVSRIRGAKNEVVGVVVAPDREAAIETAIDHHQIIAPEK